ncbi:ABC transporter substrate-binding protein [Ruegeria profundi]|uniref:ABC transporter substrate-binding protein n=1 Tax=Ruegeria profundi TaxID=1685378 RepID=A0A0X3TS88_9RHOB|nr:ABC transporter substrate-binding protein [Ruegeria profundi]KUJ77336.1 ABC transporter substrate-binding protein [Ruegeria profundi]
MLLKKTMLAAGIMAALPIFAAAEQGVTHNSVTFAQVAAFEGPASALGIGMRLGLTAAFEEANAAGGVHGRNIKLDSMDDGYEPDRSAELVKTVVEDDKHIALIGAVGTPTSSATQPIATEAGLPFIGPFTGAGFLREAGYGNIFNVRATYSAETEAWIEYLVDQQGMKSIALLYQDDGFGRVGLNGVTAALEKRGMTLAAEGTYTRNTTAVKKALLSIRKAKPDAVVMVGAYKPVAEFIKLARKMKLDATYVNISFVGSDALAKELGDAGEGVIVSQVVPFPWDDSNPLVARYTTALAAVDAAAQPGFVSLEGYIVGRLTIAALEDAGKNLTRENFLLALASLTTVDLGGVTLHYGPDDNQGMDEVFLTRITADGTFESVISGGGS